ncbi:hypothetical protein EDC04DRAFT_2606311 [Pisolithus marmoratus]|nr:hypothetical protein EDC04DRAFT_2606311 [Pisolithus marmoratus]
MDKQSYEQALLQPSIPNSSLPINLTIFRGGTSPPSTAHTECNTGDVYISSTDLFIFCEGKWERWVPSIPLRLDLYGNILYVVPCPLQGIQLISSTAARGKVVDDSVGGGSSDILKSQTSSNIIQLINRLLWKAEVTHCQLIITVDRDWRCSSCGRAVETNYQCDGGSGRAK